MTEESHIITLASSSCLNIFPENEPWCFSNKLVNALQLNPDTNYEVALKNIYHPKEHYGVVKNDEDSNVTVIMKYKVSNETADVEDKDHFLIEYIKPEQNVLSGDISYIVALINKGLKRAIRASKVGHIISKDDKHILSYIHTSKRVHINIFQDKGEAVLKSAALNFGTRIADILGFEAGVNYPFFISGEREEEMIVHGGSKVLAPYPTDADSGIDYIMVYSDIVERTHFGGNKVNILDILHLSNSESRGHSPVYYPVRGKSLDTVSIRLADQKGRNIYFKENSTTICVLHIKSVG